MSDKIQQVLSVALCHCDDTNHYGTPLNWDSWWIYPQISVNVDRGCISTDAASFTQQYTQELNSLLDHCEQTILNGRAFEEQLWPGLLPSNCH